MNEILEAIRSRVGEENLCDSCEEGGCRASMKDVPFPRVVVDANKAFPAHRITGKRCDCIVFFMHPSKDMLFAVPIELKSGNVDASEALEQLQGGADFADRFTPRVLDSICRPILFYGKRRIHERERKYLNRRKVLFRNGELAIKTAPCNRVKNLANALLE